MAIPVDSIKIPAALVKVCSGWYDGSGSMMYAVASTGGLTLGTAPPFGCDTPQEWYYRLWWGLSVELGQARRSIRLDDEAARADHDELERWEDWADSKVDQLAEAYSIID